MMESFHGSQDACSDDSASKLDGADQAKSETSAIRSAASDALIRIAEWITREGSGTANRALRSDIVILTIGRHLLPCKRPTAAWIARQHGISRQRASELWREFAEHMGPCLQFRGQWFLNRRRGASGERHHVDSLSFRLNPEHPR
jgi:hypothetical protein